MKKKKQKIKTIKFTKDGPFPEFSNFYPSPFVAADRFGICVFPTAEHYYQAAKAIRREDHDAIVDAPTPYQARKLGRTIPLVAGWEDDKDTVMRTALVAKFTQNPSCLHALYKSEKADLVEHAPWDSYWGDGHDGQGVNRLGQLLMELRKAFRKEVKTIIQDVLDSYQRTAEKITQEKLKLAFGKPRKESTETPVKKKAKPLGAMRFHKIGGLPS